MNEDLKRLTQGLNWRKIVWWEHVDLCRLGIDMLNLLCAAGLPGSERMNIDLCLGRIGEWAEKVKRYTNEKMPTFNANPEQFGNSRAYFKALCLVTVLQRDCGVRYNPAKRDFNVPLDVADSFLFGIIQGNSGTCASMPVLYCAIGYLLGYPMFLVSAKGEGAEHLFVRWDDGKVRFNIEATGQGMATPTDNHYRTGQYYLTSEIEEKGRYLKPKNMRHCLAGFLAERARICMDFKRYQNAVEAMGWAAALFPENLFYLNTAKMFCNDWLAHWNQRKPFGFPKIIITHLEKRRFAPTVPLEFELDICGVETMECLLKDVQHDRNLWEPMRNGHVPERAPVQVECAVKRDGGKSIRFSFQK